MSERRNQSAKILLFKTHTLGLDGGALPLGLLSAVNLVAGEFDVEIFDERKEKLRQSHWERWQQENLLCIGVTGLTGPEVGHVKNIVSEFRRRISTPIVWGGPHATLFPQFLIDQHRADIVVRHEGEQIFLELCRALRDGTPIADIPGIAFADPDTGKYRATEQAPRLDLSSLPPLPYHLLRHPYPITVFGKCASILESSRGCPYRCKFCYHSNEEKRHWWTGNAQWTFERFRDLIAHTPGIEHINVMDDNFFVQKKRNIELAELMVKADLGITFLASGSLRDLERFSDDELALLAESGLIRVDFGVETMSPKLQKVIDKDQSPERMLALAERLDRHGIGFWGNILAGLPGETESDFDHTLDFVKKVRHRLPNSTFSPFYVYVPYPGTVLYNIIGEQGYKLPTMEDLEEVNWSKPVSPWLTEKQRKFYGRMYFYSIFFDNKLRSYSNNAVIRFIHRLFRPIAAARVFHKFMAFPIEKWLFDHVLRIRY